MKLNLASGQRPFPEPWINVDIRQQFKDGNVPYKMDIEADIRKLPMIEDNSVDVAVASHCFEHIPLNDTLETSKEWHRILKPGGKLLVYVPNIEELSKAWLEGRIDNFIFFVNMYGADQGFPGDIHRWGYNFNELRDRMSGWNGKDNELQWSEIKQIGPSDTNISEFEGADLAYDFWILSVMLTK